ncbi:MAG: Rpn family recombination-promoting nuclease/putative transposase [Bacteroidota bacterium]
MSEKKSKKEVHQPDDRLFKVVMRKKEGAAEYLKTHYPALAELLDLETLTIESENNIFLILDRSILIFLIRANLRIVTKE